MSIKVLSVPFPFAEVGDDPVGGAEQVLMHLDRALVAAGHQSLVIAPTGSQVAGRLVPIRLEHTTICERVRRQTQEQVRLAVMRVCATEPIDLVHLHGTDFYAYLPPSAVPTLITLHLPFDWYPRTALEMQRANTWFNPVSAAQARTSWRGLRLLPAIANGIEIEVFRPSDVTGRFSLALGRICPEKGFHRAMDASRRARIPMLLGGAVYPWPEHQRYFEREIAPRLDSHHRWIGPVRGARKRRLLAAARCVLIPSQVAETSSLVAMESLASGTPVIAFRVGALPTIVEHGVTGYLVDDVEQMAEAIQQVDRLDREACRTVARQRFDVARTTNDYLDLYRHLIACTFRAPAEQGLPAQLPGQSPC